MHTKTILFYFLVIFKYFLATCDQPCENGGTCLSSGECLCTSNFKGDTCQYGNANCVSCQKREGHVYSSFSPIIWQCTTLHDCNYANFIEKIDSKANFQNLNELLLDITKAFAFLMKIKM